MRGLRDAVAVVVLAVELTTEGARTELIGGEGGDAGPPRASSGDVEVPRPRPRLLARPDARGSCDMFFLRTRFQSAVVSDGFVAGGE